MNVRPLRRGLRRASLTTAALVALTSLAACGSDGGASGASGASELRIGSIYSPVNLDPAQATGIGQTQPYLTPVYDQLTQLDSEGNVVPMLAKSWKFSKDGTSLDLELVTGVEFSDGTPFNAEAVKANLDRYKTEALPPVQTLLKSLESVEVTGEHSVSLKLVKGGGAELPDAFSAMPGYMISPAALDNPDLDVNPVGTGPYEVEKGSFRSGQSVTFVKREGDYWGGDDIYQVDRLELAGYTDPNAGLNALRSGELDMMVTQVTERVEEFSSDEGFNVAVSPTRGYFQLRINMENPQLADVRVRQAIAYAIDRESLGEVAMGTADGCKPSAQPLSGNGGVPELDEAYPYDPDKARELLAQAGAENIKLKGLYIESALSQAVQSQLKDVGIDVEFSATTPEQYIEQWSSKKYDVTPGSTTLRYEGDILYRYIDEPTLLGDTPPAVIEAADGMYDPTKTDEERVAQWGEVSKAIVEEVSGATILCHSNLAVIADSEVEGYDKIPGIYRGSYDAKFLSVG
ncbi:ABC transporter substrate-binding protein [Nocardioides marmotae]|uniref:ABC transporter substrate-binding protein n=1 Tax=Nocardioides marmotae TaxID=2663857 RepID=UPI0012B62D13|nr:ABC transporter substrate-binding protein [Nocardioides marmotae]MBC9734469.1 hypothetical protein [Nocardioides marmotae]MTB85569.1 hypothetical protein [Nocardioides marmotae]